MDDLTFSIQVSPALGCMAFKHSGHLFGDMVDGFWK